MLMGTVKPMGTVKLMGTVGNMPERPSPAERFRADHEGTAVELPYAGIPTFLKREHRDVVDLAGDEAVDVAVLGVPFDGGVSRRPGARYGPAAIRRASAWPAYLAGYKGGLTNMWTGETVDLASIGLVDCGDAPTFPTDVELTAEGVRTHVATMAADAFPVVLGGDHACTPPAVQGVIEARGLERVGLVQLDAHTDTAGESDLFGPRFHGSSAAMVADLPAGDYARIAQVGIRGYEAPDFTGFAERVGLSVATMRDVEREGIRPTVAAALESAATDADGVYVTIDVDALDPGVAPGTGTPEPGGLSAAQAMAAVEVLGGHPAVVGVDLVEVAPPYDPAGITADLASALLVALLERRVGD